MLDFDMSDDKLAEAVNVNRTTVSRWRSGERSPKLEKLPEIASIFNVNPQVFIGENDSLSIEPIFSQLTIENKKEVISFAEKKLNRQNSKVTSLDDYREEKNYVDVYGVASAGTGEYLDDTKPEKVPVIGAVPDNYDFAVQVNGDSMEPMLSDKQIIYVKKVENVDEVRNNQFVIAEVDGEAFVKKLSVTDDGIKLVSLNKEYSDIEIHDYNDFAVVGVLVI